MPFETVFRKAFGTAFGTVFGEGEGIPTFTPLDISPIIGWWDGEQGVTLTSGRVSLWDDQSIHNNNLAQTTPAMRPIQVTPGGAPNYISFEPTEFMLTAAFTQGVQSQPNTIFLVVEQKNDTGGTFMDGLVSNMRNTFADFGSYGIFAGSVFTSTVAIDTTKRIFALVFNSGSSKMFFNGGIPETGNVSNQPWDGMVFNSRFSLGAAPDQNVFDIVAYPGLLSDADFNQVGNYLADKHSLTWTDVV